MHRNMIENAINVCKVLKDNGFQAFFVGGCLRDSKMNLNIKDIDITTDALPEDVQRLFTKHLDTGLKHGTVSVKTEDDSEWFEVTTFRIDGKYDDGRHPDKVTFVKDVKDDLSRRDLTINAMAWDPIDNIWVDPFNGLSDIENKKISCVGSAKDRFMEDPLRVLRAMRFAIKLRFTISNETKVAMHDSEVIDKLVNCISKERITTELSNMLTCGKPVHDIFMEFSDVLAALFPDLKPMVNSPHNSPWHCHDIFEHCVCVIDACNTTRFDIKLAAMFHDVGKPDCRTHDIEHNCDHFTGHPKRSREICEIAFSRDLRLSIRDREMALTLVDIHDHHINSTDVGIRRMIVNFNEDVVRSWLILKEADISDHIPAPGREDAWNDLINRFNSFKTNIDRVISEMNALQIRDLAIGGNDVIELLNIKPGPTIGKILKTVFDAVVDGNLTNDKNSLINFIKSNFA